MYKKITLLIATIILLVTPIIFAETLDIVLEVQGLNPVNETFSYDGYEFNETVFRNYSITLIDMIIYSIDQETGWGFGNFTAKITDIHNQELSQSGFQPSFYILSNPPIETDTEIISLSFNYSKQSEFLEVYYNENLISRINIKELLCNQNSTCNEYENYLSCPEDCKMYSEDDICLGYSGDNYCDLDCFTDSDCEAENCNDGIKNQNETSIDQGGVCDKEDCTSKELNNELVCGDNNCSECEDMFSCPDDCLEADLCEGSDCEIDEGNWFLSFIKTGFAWFGIEFD